MQPDRLDRLIRWLMALTVLAVAVFAFTESYSHIYDLAKTHHETGVALRLLPLSVDWLILAAGLVLLHESRRNLKPPLPRWSLLLGIGATLAANVAYGIVYGWEAALISAWAPVVLVLCVEMGMYLVRSSSRKAERGPAIIPFTGVLGPEELADMKRRLDEATAKPEAVTASPEEALSGWGQLGRGPASVMPGSPEGQEPAKPGLEGIGLSNGRK
jgi:hypothetical protein